MATAAAFPNLTAPEDTMQISSPANAGYHDADIDLDFGDNDYEPGDVQGQEDEQMLTDGEPTRPATATDEMMDDEAEQVEVQVQEADMQDTPEVGQQDGGEAERNDEELIDYGEEEYFDQPLIEDTLLGSVDDEQHAEHDNGVVEELVDGEILRHPEGAISEPSATLDGGTAHETEAERVAHAETHAVEPKDDAYQYAEEYVAPVHQSPQYGSLQPVSEESISSLPAEENPSISRTEVQPRVAVDTSAYAAPEAPSTPTDTGLHPVIVYYGDHSFPLFKSERQSDGLLKDDNLANLSLNELVRHCKQRLMLKIGESLEDQEVILAFGSMGLMLSETSRAAFEHSLNDVLDVYLQLHRNDGVADCPPLSISITTQHFSNQLAMFKQAAAEGKGMSEFMPQEQDEYENDEEEEYHEPEEGWSAEETTHERAENHHQEYYAEEQHAHQDAYHEDSHSGTHHINDEDQAADDAVETHEDQHTEHEVSSGAVAAVAELPMGHKGLHDTPNDVDPAASKESDGVEEHVHLASEAQLNGEPQEVGDDIDSGKDVRENENQQEDSAASSRTLEGDDTGEYHVDWEDGELSLIGVTSGRGSFEDDNARAAAVEEAEVPPASSDATFGSTDGLKHHPHADRQHSFEDETAAANANEEYAEDTYRYQDYGDETNNLQEQHTSEDAASGDYKPSPLSAQDAGDSYEHGLEHVADDQLDGEESYEFSTNAEQDAPGQGLPPQAEEDHIDFDEDETEEARQVPMYTGATDTASGSPLGKRSFDAADADDLADEEPELKRSRTG